MAAALLLQWRMNGPLLRARWNRNTVVVHGEIIDAATLPAMIAANHQGGLAICRWQGQNAELLALSAVPGQHRDGVCAGRGTGGTSSGGRLHTALADHDQ